MKARFYFMVCAFLLTLCGCSLHDEPLQLKTVEKEMVRDPELSLHLLRNLQEDIRQYDEAVQMKYRILMIQALDKTNHPLNRYRNEIKDLANYYEKNGNSNERMRAYYYMAGFYRDNKQPFEAMSWYQKSLGVVNLNSKLVDRHLVSVVYAQMSDLLQYSANWSESLKLIKAALSYEDDPIGKFEILHNIGSRYIHINRDSAIHYYDLTMDLARSIKCQSPTYQAIICTQVLYFSELQMYDKVRCRMPYMSKKCTPENKALCYLAWAYVYESESKLDSAETYYKKTITTDVPYQKSAAYYRLMKLKGAQGDWKAATQYGLLFADMADSLQQMSDAERMQQVNSLFDYRSLNKETAEANAAAEQRGWALVASVVLFLLLIVGIGYRCRRKTKHYRTIAAKVEQQAKNLQQTVDGQISSIASLTEKLEQRNHEMQCKNEEKSDLQEKLVQRKEELRAVAQNLENATALCLQLQDDTSIQKDKLKNAEDSLLLADKIKGDLQVNLERTTRDYELLRKEFSQLTEKYEAQGKELSQFRREQREWVANEATIRQTLAEQLDEGRKCTPTQAKEVKKVVNAIYPHILKHIKEIVPRATESYIEIVCLTLLDFRPHDICILTGNDNSNVLRVRGIIFKAITGRPYEKTDNFKTAIETLID